jgi:hypothetical protein
LEEETGFFAGNGIKKRCRISSSIFKESYKKYTPPGLAFLSSGFIIALLRKPLEIALPGDQPLPWLELEDELIGMTGTDIRGTAPVSLVTDCVPGTIFTFHFFRHNDTLPTHFHLYSH